MTRHLLTLLAVLAGGVLLATLGVRAATPIPVMMLDGESAGPTMTGRA
jgi:hypothetical protein